MRGSMNPNSSMALGSRYCISSPAPPQHPWPPPGLCWEGWRAEAKQEAWPLAHAVSYLGAFWKLSVCG